MKPEQENFDQLRRLLKLKRHEQPPPGYFNNFSGEVLARIRAGQTGHDNILEWLFAEAPWAERLFKTIQHNPAMAWGFGAVTAALVITGVAMSENSRYNPNTAVPIATSTSPENTEAAPIAFTQPEATQPTSVAANTGTNQSGPSLFDQLKPTAVPASFKP